MCIEIFTFFIFRSCPRSSGRSSHCSHWQSSNRSRLTVGKRDSSNKLPEFKKRWVSESYPESCPNHTRIIPQTSLFSLQPFTTGYTTPPAASEKNPTTAPCSVQQHPSLASTLAARVGYSTYPPCSTLKHHPLQQHQQASLTAHSSSTFHPHPLTSMPAPKQGLQHTPLWQQHLQSSPSGSTCSSTLSATSIAPNCTHHFDSKQPPATSTLQRHSSSTTMPAPKRTHHSDSSTHSVNSMPAPKRSTYGILANSWNIFGGSVG